MSCEFIQQLETCYFNKFLKKIWPLFGLFLFLRIWPFLATLLSMPEIVNLAAEKLLIDEIDPNVNDGQLTDNKKGNRKNCK